MQGIKDFLLNKVLGFVPAGWGTIVSGVVLILYGVVSLLGAVVPGLPVLPVDQAFQSIVAGFGLIFLKRSQVNNTTLVTDKIEALSNKIDNK